MAAKLWNKAPFIRLLAAMSAGIVCQWLFPLPLITLGAVAAMALLAIVLYAFMPLVLRYRLRTLNGFFVLLLMALLGALLVWEQDIRNTPTWFGHRYQPGDAVLVVVQEPLVQKAKSYKAIAQVSAVYRQRQAYKAAGDVILYFKKDTLPPGIGYGSKLLVSALLQPIKNAGNPGAFNYQTYSLFQGITHQVFATPDHYVILQETERNWFTQLLFNCRQWVVTTLRTFIKNPKELGLAEALLIGYKDDLDKNLVQAYSNTGVVHIIAISGLHLGLIYWLLLQLTRPLKSRQTAWLRLLLVVAGLWLFSLLAGAGPSVLRSALMFSLIAFGDVALRKTNIFNTLAFSAFVLLCINPFLLWNVGFQLSYAAVLSIVLFFQPVYNWFSFSNKLVDFIWKLTAVTIAAQVLTLPISIYHFHQMPLLFLVANMIAVPLSSLLLIGLLFLCGVAFIPPVAGFTGNVLEQMMTFLNYYIEGLDHLPFATWNGLSITVVQAVLLLCFVLLFCHWLMERQRRFVYLALSFLAAFMAVRSFSFFNAHQQQKLIVYNVPKHTAIDIISGRSYAFLGDTSLVTEGFARNFHLQPSRILHRITAQKERWQQKSFVLAGRQILVLDETLPLATLQPKPGIDILILSKNPKLYINNLLNAFQLKQIVIDGSVPAGKAARWQHDCDSLQIPCYRVSEKGAFVMNW